MNLARDYGGIRTEKQLWGCSLAQTLGRAIDIIFSLLALSEKRPYTKKTATIKLLSSLVNPPGFEALCEAQASGDTIKRRRSRAINSVLSPQPALCEKHRQIVSDV